MKLEKKKVWIVVITVQAKDSRGGYMMGRIFGTDGVRGEANSQLTPELAFQLGRAAASLLRDKKEGKQAIVIGRDTRISGDMLEGALIAGVCSAGIDVYRVGVMPTPAIAYLTRELKAISGVVISASHNPASDNGIKFFDYQGYKLPDELEDQIEDLIDNGVEQLPYPTGAEIGRVKEIKNGLDLYLEFVKKIIKVDLKGLKIVVDCANGAASEITPRLLRELGADVINAFDQPDGLNINKDCGSTNMDALQKLVLKEKADLGIAHDGDADRVLFVDAKGNLVDGDQVLVICGLDLLREGALKKDTVVVTVMSNLGLKQALVKNGVKVEETKVGDRYVLERMREVGAIIGGEQSGHVIFLEHNTTGDGIVTALKLLEVMQKTGKSLEELASQMEKLPQVLLNVRVKDKRDWEKNKAIRDVVALREKLLGDKGRILVRASGTEPLIRVMAEGNDLEELQQVTKEIAKVVEEELN